MLLARIHNEKGQKQQPKNMVNPITGLLASYKSTNALFKPNSSGKLSIPVYSKTNEKEKERKKKTAYSLKLKPQGRLGISGRQRDSHKHIHVYKIISDGGRLMKHIKSQG